MPSSTDTSEPSDGRPNPTNPAASCTSNNADGRAPTARSRIGRSLAPACVIMVAGARSTASSARTSHASGSTSATPFAHDTCTRQSCGQ
jgi:hypothetical protein